MIRIIACRCGEPAKVEEIDSDLRAMQEFVGIKAPASPEEKVRVAKLVVALRKKALEQAEKKLNDVWSKQNIGKKDESPRTD